MSSLDSLIQAPNGTKLWLLDLGYIDLTEPFLLRYALSNASRELVFISALIEHPSAGLILFDTGSSRADKHLQKNYDPSQELDAAIASTGNSITDVRTVVVSHMHADHAGGLDHFRNNTDVEIYIHETELKHAFHAAATTNDMVDVYNPAYHTFDLNWRTFAGDKFELAQGITLHHAPGHTPGLSVMQVNLQDSGTWIFTSDQYHVHENFEENRPQGYLLRDDEAWKRSNQMIHGLQKRTGANLVFGHDKGVFNGYFNSQVPYA
ncbi:beta-lactamase-like protein [Pyrenochaeta sp. MPI-SDFR-AT-0127]|nr:beta-lactamase-like protein [Pyrenochaeta sp. MPI-SDFR-AT-0127]